MSTGGRDFIWPPAADSEAAAKPAPSNVQPAPPDPAGSAIAELRQRLAHAREGDSRPRRSAAPLVIAALAIVAAAEGAVIAIQHSQVTSFQATSQAAAARTITRITEIARSLTSDGAAHADASPAVDKTKATSRAAAPALHRRARRAPRAAIAAAPPEPRYGLLYLNALPWADVAIDGHPAGQTPLGRIQLPAGVHEVRFTHPQLGEQVRKVVVDPNVATRLGVDLRQ